MTPAGTRMDGPALAGPAGTAWGAGAAGAGGMGSAAGAAWTGAAGAAAAAAGAGAALAGDGVASGEKIGPGFTAAGFGGAGSAAAGFGGAGSAAAGFAGPGSTVAGFGGAAADPPGTRPIYAGQIRPGDYADVLPPVSYAPPGAGNGRGTGTLSRRDGPDGGPAASAARATEARRRYPLLVFATMVIAVSISVILPIAGTLGALAALVLLRAGALAQRGVDQRRTEGGARATNGLVAAAAFPWFLFRSVLRTLLVAPLALAVGAAAAVISVVAMPSPDPLPRAVAYGTGALVAFYGLGPGSGKSRRQLNRIFSAVIGTGTTEAVMIICLSALALAAAAAAVSSGADYWPFVAPTGFIPHLPGWHEITQVVHFRFWQPRFWRLSLW
jgi:hypothetical protein